LPSLGFSFSFLKKKKEINGNGNWNERALLTGENGNFLFSSENTSKFYININLFFFSPFFNVVLQSTDKSKWLWHGHLISLRSFLCFTEKCCLRPEA